jgi:hypothetical protein
MNSAIMKSVKWKYVVLVIASFLLGAGATYFWEQSQLNATKQNAAVAQKRYESSVRIYDTVVSCLVNGNCDLTGTLKKVEGIIGNDKQLWNDFMLRTVPHGK